MVDTPENQPSVPEVIAQPVIQKYCAKCGTLNTPDAKFCYKCGQALPATAAPGKKVCTGCGTINEAASQYCLKCGLKLPEVTGTGLTRKYGGFWIRLGAFIIDSIGLSVASSIITTPLMSPTMEEFLSDLPSYYSDYNDPAVFFERIGQFMGAMFLISLVQTLLYCVYYTVGVGKWSTTIGKAACGLKVVRADGGRVSYWRAFARYWANMLNGFTAGLTYLVIAFHGKKQGIHDMICDTLVVKKN